jgi:MAF protein
MTQTAPQFILASGSPRRRELLSWFPWSFSVVVPNIDEQRREGEKPFDYVSRLSAEKAALVARASDGNTVVLGADTIVLLADDLDHPDDGELLGKPADPDEATAMIKKLRGRKHLVCTAMTLVNATGGKIGVEITRLTRTIVTMRDYSDEEIAAYVATGDPADKAGAYAIQNEQFHPVADLDGSYNNVVGLPTETLRMMALVTGWLPEPSLNSGESTS